MNHVYIEFSHIYQDETFGAEQIQSVEILKELTSKLNQKNDSYVTSILVDDFHASEKKWDISELLKQTMQLDITPDVIAFESTFTAIADEIINQIPSSFKKWSTFKKEEKDVLFFDDGFNRFALKDVFATHETHKCVILSCAWLACRLGVFPFPDNSYVTTNDQVLLNSNKVVSILSKKYEKLETNVLHLLSIIGHEEKKKQIHYLFY